MKQIPVTSNVRPRQMSVEEHRHALEALCFYVNARVAAAIAIARQVGNNTHGNAVRSEKKGNLARESAKHDSPRQD